MKEALNVSLAMIIVSMTCVFVAHRFFRRPNFGVLMAAMLIGGVYLDAPDQIAVIAQKTLDWAIIIAYIAAAIFTVILFYVLLSGRRMRDCLNIKYIIGEE